MHLTHDSKPSAGLPYREERHKVAEKLVKCTQFTTGKGMIGTQAEG
jgi:hypothetical protein